jgi:hypothetical protein
MHLIDELREPVCEVARVVIEDVCADGDAKTSTKNAKLTADSHVARPPLDFVSMCFYKK